MDLEKWEVIAEIGGLAIFAFVIWREQRSIRSVLHAMNNNLSRVIGALFLERRDPGDRGGGK